MKLDQSLKDKHILMVFAHCDDELVCGWPILQDPEVKKSLLIVSSDRNNFKRKWCNHRKFITQDLCRNLGIEVRILDYDSEFYKLDHRSGMLSKFEKEVLFNISKFSFDYIFTHNPHGEYGHLDHVLLSNLILKNNQDSFIYSNISMISDWTELQPLSPNYYKIFYRNLIGEFYLDNKFYQKIKRFYESRGVWTWSQEPQSTCSLYFS